jgi:hypothetical protein
METKLAIITLNTHWNGSASSMQNITISSISLLLPSGEYINR